MIYEKVSAHSGIAASILTFALTLLGFSNLEITVWWHYLLAFAALIGCYVVCLFLVEVALLVVKKITRPEPKVNFQKDYADIEKYIHDLYLKESQYDTATSLEYKTILSRELFLLGQKLKTKMDRYTRDSHRSVVKNPPKIPDTRLFKLYSEYCEYVINRHKPKP